jgi:hypothetical protein
MRDLFIVTLLCLTAAIVADQVWLGGKYSNAIKREIGLDVGSARRQ